jgi:CRP-like cAMP-binding protein
MTGLEQNVKSYFGVISDDDLKSIVSLFKLTTIKKGEYFLKAGKQCDKLSFIQSGILRVFIETEDKDVTQWISTAGFFITDVASLIFQNPARYTIQALTDTEMLTITRDDYNRINNLIPLWYQYEKNFLALYFIMMEDRIFSHLSMTSEERYHRFFESNKELFNQVPLQYIASMLGMTPETFSRIRKKQLL